MLDKSRAVALFHPFFPVNGDPGLRYECHRGGVITHTHKADPGLIWLLFSLETMQGSFSRAAIQISAAQGKQHRDPVT